MVRIRQYKNRIEEFLSGENGQRFFNFAYSIGAAIVIWGALFKILHLPGGNLLLAIGMGTEVLMFILTAFDRPPRHYNWEEVFPELDGEEARSKPQITSGPVYTSQVQPNSDHHQVIQGAPVFHPVGEASENYVGEMESLVKEISRLRETTSALNTLYEMQLKSVSAQLSAIENSGKDVSAMREMMEKSARQSERYCEETEKMAKNMATLNDIYSGMISAMSGRQSS